MGLQTIRQKLRDTLADDVDVAAFFVAVVQNRPLNPNEEDGITIFKRRVGEVRDQTGPDKKMTFTFDIICVMVRGNSDAGDVAQMEAYRLVCNCLSKEANKYLDCTVDGLEIKGARWDEETTSTGEAFYTTITVEITAWLNAEDR